MLTLKDCLPSESDLWAKPFSADLKNMFSLWSGEDELMSSIFSTVGGSIQL